MNKKFVTIFPICENVHLTKDLGQIPFFLHHKYHYESSIVCYKNSKEYSNLEGEVKGLNLELIENTGRIRFLEKSVLRYIRKNAKKIDILNLYHYSKFTFVYGILYKKYNPKGVLFLTKDSPIVFSIVMRSTCFKNCFSKYFKIKFLNRFVECLMMLPFSKVSLYPSNFKNKTPFWLYFLYKIP